MAGEHSSLDCSQSPYFSVGFSRPVRFDGTAAILVCKSERDLTLGARFYKPRRRRFHRSVPVSRIPRKNRGTVNSLTLVIKTLFPFSVFIFYSSQ